MRRILMAATTVALVALTAGFAACGGDDDDNGGGQTSDIRINKGLTVAALNGDLSAALQAEDTDGASADIASAPSTGNLGTDEARSSISAPDRGGYTGSPSFQVGTNGITIVGYGTATTDADAAIVEFYFGRTGYDDKPIPLPEPLPPTDSGSGSSEPGSDGTTTSRDPDSPVGDDVDFQEPTEVTEITEADLQAVIDALTGAGVSRDDIEFIGQGYYDPYYASATLRATINDIDAVDGAIEAATDATNGLADIYTNGTNISYTLSDCEGLERAAMEAAVEDAADRGAILADVLGVALGSVTGAAQYSSSSYGGTPCASGYYGPVPVAELSYTQEQPREVQVYSEITVTYAIN